MVFRPKFSSDNTAYAGDGGKNNAIREITELFGYYRWKNANNRNKLAGLRYLFDELDIAYGDLVLYIEPSVPVNQNVEQLD